MDLLDVLLGVQEQCFRLFNFLLHYRDIALQLLQILRKHTRYLQKLQKIARMLRTDLLHNLPCFVFLFDELFLLLNHGLVVGGFVLQDLDEIGGGVEVWVAELGVFGQELFYQHVQVYIFFIHLINCYLLITIILTLTYKILVAHL